MRRVVRNVRGFTLVELMIVVAIIGVLAALAIYGVSRYLKHAKTAEASRMLGRIEGAADAFYQLESNPLGDAEKFVHQFCPNAGPTPTVFPVAQKVTPADAEWNSAGWRCLKMTASGPLFYQYTVTANGLFATDAEYTATAQGDLDGNGARSRFTLAGKGGPYGDTMRTQFTVVNEDE